MNHHHRLRKEYGSIKAAFTYCHEMNMCQTEAMRFLEVNSTFIQYWTQQLKFQWTPGIKTSTLSAELASERMTAQNKARKGKPLFCMMKPREINGLVYYPAETAHRCLMQGRMK